MLDFDDLLHQIPRLIGRLIAFEAFAVYLLDERRGDFASPTRSAIPTVDKPAAAPPGMGLVGVAVATEQPVLVNDLRPIRATSSSLPG